MSSKTAHPFSAVALVLQGGGALGAYQAGVYQALDEAGITPSWVSGISIGAINSAIIAGNPPEARVARLREFWELVTTPTAAAWFAPLGEIPYVREAANQFAAWSVAAGGAKGFFVPRLPPPSIAATGPADASWYDTTPLRATLEQLVDFARINSGEMRFSVGAVNVRTGNFDYFDNAVQPIDARHIMASGALPPGFPAVEIDGQYYWDGGIVSNTPLEWVLTANDLADTLIFQVDLWSAIGSLPTDLASVAVRTKDIQFSSRTRAIINNFRQQQKLRGLLRQAYDRLGADERRALGPEAGRAARADAVYNIALLIYHSPTYELESKDYEFSRQTMEEHWQAGLENARVTLAHKEIFRRPADPSGLAVFDFLTPPSKPAHTKPRHHPGSPT